MDLSWGDREIYGDWVLRRKVMTCHYAIIDVRGERKYAESRGCASLGFGNPNSGGQHRNSGEKWTMGPARENKIVTENRGVEN